jgi:hypothetical protein
MAGNAARLSDKSSLSRRGTHGASLTYRTERDDANL